MPCRIDDEVLERDPQNAKDMTKEEIAKEKRKNFEKNIKVANCFFESIGPDAWTNSDAEKIRRLIDDYYFGLHMGHVSKAILTDIKLELFDLVIGSSIEYLEKEK